MVSQREPESARLGRSCSSTQNDSAHKGLKKKDCFRTCKGSSEAKAFKTCSLNFHLQEVCLENFLFSGKLFQKTWSWKPPQMM